MQGQERVNRECIVARVRETEPFWPSGTALGYDADDGGSIPRFGCPFSSHRVDLWTPSL